MFLGKVNGKALELLEHKTPSGNYHLKFTTNKKKHNQFWFLQYMKPYGHHIDYSFVASNYGSTTLDNGFEVLVVNTKACSGGGSHWSNWCQVKTARTENLYNLDHHLWKMVGDQLVSKYLDATLGVEEHVGLVVFLRQENIKPNVHMDFSSNPPSFDPLLKGIAIN